MVGHCRFLLVLCQSRGHFRLFSLSCETPRFQPKFCTQNCGILLCFLAAWTLPVTSVYSYIYFCDMNILHGNIFTCWTKSLQVKQKVKASPELVWQLISRLSTSRISLTVISRLSTSRISRTANQQVKYVLMTNQQVKQVQNYSLTANHQVK